MPSERTGLCPSNKESYIGQVLAELTPKLICVFAATEDHSINEDESILRYLKLPKTPFRTNWRVKSFMADARCLKLIKRPSFEYVEHKKLNLQEMKINFFCSRGTFESLIHSPRQEQSFKLGATKYKGVIYMGTIKFKDEPRFLTALKEKSYKEQKNFCSQIFVGDPADESDRKNTPYQLCRGLFSAQLDNFGLLYTANIKGIERCNKITDFNDIGMDELQKQIVDARLINGKLNLTHPSSQTLSLWAQLTLKGAEKLVCGFQNVTNIGLIGDMKELMIKDFEEKNLVQPEVPLNFLKAFLELVSNQMSGIDCPQTVFEYTYQPIFSDHIKLERKVGPNEYDFLPESYIEYVKSL